MTIELSLTCEKFAPYGRILLENTSLRLSSGELCFLEGKSGCGKTSVLRALCGLIEEFGFRVLVNNAPIENLDLRKHVCFVSQVSYFWKKSVKDNLELAFNFSIRSSDEGLNFSLLEDLMQGFDLGHISMEQDATTLSGGESQRLAIIRALLLNPTCLLLDEPLSACDSSTSRRVERKLLEWMAADQSRCILWVSHNSETLKNVKARNVTLEERRFVEGERDE